MDSLQMSYFQSLNSLWISRFLNRAVAGRIVIGPLFTFFLKYVKFSTLLEMKKLYVLNKFNFLKFSQFNGKSPKLLKWKLYMNQEKHGLFFHVLALTRLVTFLSLVWEGAKQNRTRKNAHKTEKSSVSWLLFMDIGVCWCRVSDIIGHLLCCNGDQDKLGGKSNQIHVV